MKTYKRPDKEKIAEEQIAELEKKLEEAERKYSNYYQSYMEKYAEVRAWRKFADETLSDYFASIPVYDEEEDEIVVPS